MAGECLQMGVNPVCYSMHHQMAHGGPIRIVNTGKHILPRVNDGIVTADFWEEVGDPFTQAALGILSDKQRDRGVFPLR